MMMLSLNFKKMQTKKMSLANIKGKLSRAEMKNIMEGSDSGAKCGYDISCDGHSEFQSCGSSGNCGCGWVSGSLYCRMDS